MISQNVGWGWQSFGLHPIHDTRIYSHFGKKVLVDWHGLLSAGTNDNKDMSY